MSVPKSLQTLSSKGDGGIKSALLLLYRFISSVTKSFFSHQCPLRAAALTYTTVLSFIPLLAIAFAVLKGLGVQNALEPFLQQIAGDSEETIASIVAYVNNTNVRSLGAIGLGLLIVTVIFLMDSIEESFNTVCGVRETRSIQRRFSDYLSVLIVGPILLLVATSMTSSLQSQWLLQWLINNSYMGEAIRLGFRLIPYLSIWVAMIFLYMFIPNTRINFYSALLGGVVAGTAWELAQWGYFHFQIGVANYNAIYGTLAAVPIFLVWIYTSWLIVLYGLEIVFAHQHRDHYLAGYNCNEINATSREELALAVLLRIHLAFRRGETPPTARVIADELAVPNLLISDIIPLLSSCGFILAAAGREPEPAWLPASDPAQLLAADFIDSLRGPAMIAAFSETGVMKIARDIVGRGSDGCKEALVGLRISDLLARIKG